MQLPETGLQVPLEGELPQGGQLSLQLWPKNPSGQPISHDGPILPRPHSHLPVSWSQEPWSQKHSSEQPSPQRPGGQRESHCSP